MVVLHGLGDSHAGYRWLPEALDLPWMNYALVNAPDHYFGGYSWYDFAGDLAPGVERSWRLLCEFMSDLGKRGFPASEMYLFGFSQGCLMTLEVALRCSEVLAGCIGVSGYVHEPERLLKLSSPVARQQRILVTHGTMDTMIPIDPVRRQIRQLQAAGIPITWREYEKAHTIVEEELPVFREFIVAGRRRADEVRTSAGGAAS